MSRWNDALVWISVLASIGCETAAPAAPGEWTGRDWDVAPYDLDAGRVEPDTGPLGSCAPEYFSLTTEDGWIDHTDLAGTPSRVAWGSGGEVWFGELTEAGTLTGRARLDIESNSPSIAEQVVVWAEQGIERSRVLAQIGDTAMRVGSGSAEEILPTVEAHGDSWVASWLELTEDDTRVVARIWPNTEHLIGRNAVVEQPALTTHGDAAFVAWRTESELHVSRVHSGGGTVSREAVVDGTIEVNHPANGAFAISMHSNGGLLVFESTDVAGSTALFGVRLASDGTARGAELRLSEPGELDAGVREVGTFHGGYVIAYLGTPHGGTQRMLRLVFVHGSTGDRVHTLDLAAARNDASASLSIAPDGTIVTVWASESELLASRVSCRDVWLRCTPDGV